MLWSSLDIGVSPRHGLQSEYAIKAESRRIEVTSFVNPKAVPQMAYSEHVCARLPQRRDVTYFGLVINARGTGFANVWAAIEAGENTIEASVEGLGGCPLCPGCSR